MIFDYICHRRPERSFFIHGHQFPVCVRCTGYYISLFIYFIYTYFYYVDYSYTLILFSILLNVPAFIDGFTQFVGYRESNNALRLVTGLLGGWGLGIFIKASKFYLFTRGL